MRIEMWPIGRVVPYEKNPRLNAGAVDAVAKSLREFGWRQPIVVDRDGVIVVGHTRWLAAKQLGLIEVPVHVAADLTPAQAKAYRIADNQTATIAEWDMDLLPLELADLKSLEFDLDLLGFGQDELAKLMGTDAAARLAAGRGPAGLPTSHPRRRFGQIPRALGRRRLDRRRYGSCGRLRTH
jgi:ParB-like chromosome segregation protein Spo0J